MSAIKKFFEKKKLDLKFKKLGSGHKLDKEKPAPSQSQAGPSSKPVEGRRFPLSSEAQRAAEAAMARLDKPTVRKPVNTLDAEKAAMRMQMAADLEARNKNETVASGPTEVVKDHADVLSGVFFKCPMVGPDVLPKVEMEAKINEFLLIQLCEEPEMASAMMIHTLNKEKEKGKSGIDIICKYLDNLINNNGEEKFRKIRIANRVFQEKVTDLEGVHEFLQAVGFTRQMLPNPEVEEEFYVIPEDAANNKERINTIKSILLAAEPIRPELDRGLKVLLASGNVPVDRFQIPDIFYAISKEEMKREQQIRTEAVEKMGMLRTKAMKERDEQRQLRKYRYTLLRVKFPDSMILQGTFRSQEKVSSLFEYVRENIENSWMPFVLRVTSGQKLDENNSTFAEVNLVPASVLNFTFDKTILAEVASQQGGNTGNVKYLRPDILQLASIL